MRLPGQPGCALRRLVGVLLLATLLGALVCFHAAADELANCSHPLFSFHQTMALALQVVLGLTLFDPPGAVEDRPRQIQEDAAAARKAAEEAASRLAPKPWRALEEIDGLWGEAQYGCRVVYRFERQDRALTVTLVRKDPGMGDYRMTASLAQTGEGDRLDAVLRTSTAPDETDGQALVFTYFSDGAVKRLGWLNETRSRAETRLEWCGEA